MHQVCEILESDQLNVRNEELVFDSVCRWIDFDPERRRGHMARLLKTIRLGLLTTQFFVEKVYLPQPLLCVGVRDSVLTSHFFV